MSLLELENLIRAVARLFYDELPCILLDYFALLPGKRVGVVWCEPACGRAFAVLAFEAFGAGAEAGLVAA